MANPERNQGRRRTLTRLAAAALCAIILGSAGTTAAFTYFRIGTGDPTSTFFAIGTAIAGAISNPPGSRACDVGGSCGVPNLIAVAQTTQGSIENIRAIQAGELDSGLGNADIVHWASIGESVFRDEGPADKLRVVANLYQESVHFVVRADSGFTSIADLAGKRIAVGGENSDSRVTARLILRAYGLGETEYTPVFASTLDAASMLQNDDIDAIVAIGSHPIPIIAALAESVPIDLLSLDDEVAGKLREQYGFLLVDVIPGNLYAGIDATVTIGIGALWLVNADLDPELVYEVTKSLWHPVTRSILDRTGPIGQSIERETALIGLPIPLHPGAELYYTESGAAARSGAVR
ncbi:MAG: TAXI family TRAP transporter solute-binding subunit [Rhodospirillaceae bacterium]|nr:TAXI family TRAP transporter solute-binding subunit [Rhodospirillaceae bacterium]